MSTYESDESDHRNAVAISCTDDSGATAVEYALLAALIAAVIAGIIGTVGQQVRDLFNTMQGTF